MQNSVMLVSKSVHEINFTVTFDANGGVTPIHSMNATVGIKLGELPVPTFGDKYFNGWYTEKTGGSKVTEDSLAGLETIALHAHWIDPIEITWNATANGGTLEENTYKYYPGVSFGVLPKANGPVDKPNLAGWYTTQSEGGEQININSIVPSETTTYYARYNSYNDPIGVVICDTANLYFNLYNHHSDYWGECSVENEEMHWRTGKQDSVYFTGDDSCQYGLSTTVTGPGTFSFYAMASTEGEWDGMVFFMDSITDKWELCDMAMSYVNGERNNQPYVYGGFAYGGMGWSLQSLSIPEGEHTLYLLYVRDAGGSGGENKVWLSGVSWIST